MEPYTDEKRKKVVTEMDEKFGGVLYAFFRIKEPVDNPRLHQQAAIQGIKIWDEEFLSKERRKELKIPHFTIEPEKMRYEKISIKEFFYPEIVCGENSEIKNYFGAMTDPPYSSSVTKEDFERYNQVLFPNPEALTIYLWNNTWSSFFNHGLEWWGALLWTVYDAQSGIMTAVGASNTD